MKIRDDYERKFPFLQMEKTVPFFPPFSENTASYVKLRAFNCERFIGSRASWPARKSPPATWLPS